MKLKKNSVAGIPRFYLFLTNIRALGSTNLFLLMCVAAIIIYTIYTQDLIRRLQEDALTVTQTYAELIRTAITEQMNFEEMNVIFDEVIKKSNVPIIITDTLWQPIMWHNISTGLFFGAGEIPTEDVSIKTRRIIEKRIIQFKHTYEPKTLFIRETGQKIGYLVFGNPVIIRSLRWIPFIEIGTIVVCVLFVYMAFKNIRITERGNLWVGLAKETAHQLGTPISSLMGWIEYIRATDRKGTDDDDPVNMLAQIQNICDDMEKDVLRLSKVTNRFSQIGSIPALKPIDINEVLTETMEYFRHRLPLLGKTIALVPEFSTIPAVAANRELLEWVFENLLKNSVDAIDKTSGRIEIKTEYIEVDHLVRIYHRDNGKGISWESQKKIFSPGFTTKKRGWGLGLTLAKRIIEDYHRGKIYVNWSAKGKGTVFCVEIPVPQDNAPIKGKGT